jgi:predicted nucleic acid-binding protein
LEAEGSTLLVSRQVLREYLAVVTRTQATAPALPLAAAIADVRRFRAAFDVAAEGPGVLDRLLDLLAAGRGTGRQVHDANIVATMLAHGIGRLLTFNSADFRQFSPAIDIEPLS